MNFVQLLRKANDLKAQLTAEGGSDAWVSRQALQDAFHQLLLLDLETALDKKLEQELWNHVFKNHISSLQHKARDRMNPKRSEVQAMLSLLLDNASGFYIQLLQEICSAFNVQLVCRIKAQRLGLFQDTLPSSQKPVQPKAVSCHYICQHCLVHLGDIARYRNDTQQAESFYCHAASLVPSNGQPYNQLAIVSATKGDQLSMAFYYIRSIAVKHPFPAAATNLQTTYAKLVDRDEVKIFKMREVELIHYFIKFHAIMYLATCEQDLQVASSIKDKLEENFRSHLSQEILTSRQLTQMAAINLFALHSIRQHVNNGERGTKAVVTDLGGLVGAQDLGPYAANNLQCWTLVMGFTFNLLQMMLHYAPQKGGESPVDGWPGLPAVRLLLGWIYLQPAIFDDPVLSNKTGVWSKLGRVLTSLQVDASPQGDDSTSSLPLPEDNLLDGFTPLQEFQRDLDFGQNKRQGWNRNAINQERSQRLSSQGKWLAHHQPSLLKVETNSSNKLVFTSPLGDDVTSRRSSHHQQRQQRAAKAAASNAKGSESSSRSASVEKETPKKIVGMQRKDGSRERGSEENQSKTIAVQAIMSRPNSDVNKPTVTYKGQERSNQGSNSKSSKSPSSSTTKDQEATKRHVQWQNPPHAFAQEPSSYYPKKPHPTSQPHPMPQSNPTAHPHPNAQPHLGPGSVQPGQQPQGTGPASAPRHPPPSGPYPQQVGQQRLPHPYGHPPPPPGPPPPGVPPPSMGMPPPPPDQMYPPPPLGPPPSFNPSSQNAPHRAMHPPPPRQMGPPPMPHVAPPGWQQPHRDVSRDGQPPHLPRDGPPSPRGVPPHMQPPKVQIPPPMPQGTQMSPNSNMPQSQGHHHHQGGWPARPGPMPTVGERQEDHPPGDTMSNISMWNAAMQDKLGHTHMQRNRPDMQQYQQQGQQGMGRDTSPIRSPIGNSPQFRLSPSVEDFGQGPVQASQPPRRMSNPTEMQMQGYGPNQNFDQGRMNYMPSMANSNEHPGRMQSQQKQQQQPSVGPPPQILDSQGANLLELLAKMQQQIVPENPVGSSNSGTKMRYSPEEHSVEAFRANLDNSQQKNVRDPPGFRTAPERFYDDQLAKNNGRPGGSEFYGMQQGEQRGTIGYNQLGNRSQGGSAFRKVQPQQPDQKDLFPQSDLEAKVSRSYEPGDAFSFFTPSSNQQEKQHPQQQQMLGGENLKFGRDIFGQDSGLQEPQSFPYRRSSGGLYEKSASGFTSSQPPTSSSDTAWRMENREESNQHLRGIFPGPQAGGGSSGGGGAGSNAVRRGSEETTSTGYNARWTGDSREQMVTEGTRRPSQDALFNQMNSGGSGQSLFQQEPFIERESSSSSYSTPQHHQSAVAKNSYFSGSALKGKQPDEENVFSSSGNSYSLFSSPSPWSSRQEEGDGGLSKSGEGLGSTLGLKWREPQLSSSPTSSLLPERIQSIWSSPLRSEQSPLEKILGHTVSLEQQKPDT
ncbi:nonsense-mediated mRNA decay factor SMG7-like [Lytechinus pictus]|uniref:nonsense-mediated mRNA decay factor SMG7-like n=1 Tax=Lytechinus pictus TaxID=7653 RepID=UPI0030BA234B